MAQISKYLLSDKMKQEIDSVLLEIFASLYKKEDIGNFFEDFLSPTERTVLAKRITIALMLKQGYSYEIIKQILKVSQPTIAGVNLKLKYSGRGYHKILDRILAEKKIKGIFDKIENFALEVLTIGHGKGSGAWFDLKVKKQQAVRSSII